MNRQDLMLAVLAVDRGASYTPVQVQKLFFLLDARVADRFGGPYFEFSPWDYGPFDRAVYDELEGLEAAGLVQISRSPGGRWRTYRLTMEGQERGEQILSQNVEAGIADEFAVDQPGVVLDRFAARVDVGWVEKRGLDTEARQRVLHQADVAAVHLG